MTVTARKTFQGAWAIAAEIDGYLEERQYFGYTKREAVQMFKEHFKK